MQQAFSIPLWRYSKEKHAWLPGQPDNSDQKSRLNEFRVLTYNVWFSLKYQPMRFQGLCDILNRSDAQIIGLQESSCFFPYL